MELLVGIGLGCIVLSMAICLWCALGNIDELLKNADEWEEGISDE